MFDHTGSDPERAVPSWLITEDFVDERLGLLKTGKEASVFLVERTSGDRRCLLADKSYKSLQRRSFRQDSIYREGRTFRSRRMQKAAAAGSVYGKRLLNRQWMDTELNVMRALWERGGSVPYPLESTGNGVLMEYIGDEEQAAPRLVHSQVPRAALGNLFEQVREEIFLIVEAGYVHGDLSAYNILVWDQRLWVIDFPQAVDISVNPHALDLLHRDVVNVCTWFDRRGCAADASALFADVLDRVPWGM